MNERQIEQHVTVLGWLHLVSNFLMVAVAIFTYGFLVVIGQIAGMEDPAAREIMPVIGALTGGFMLLLALPGLAAGYGLLKRRPWARGLTIIVGVISLMSVPIGTAIGLYTLYVLFQSEVTDYFALAKAA